MITAGAFAMKSPPLFFTCLGLCLALLLPRLKSIRPEYSH
jgi:hypothetical protein